MNDPNAPNTRRTSRLRQTAPLRRLVRETRLAASDLLLPVFVCEVADRAGPVESMPGIQRRRLGELEEVLGAAVEARIGGILLFGLPAAKDQTGSGSSAPDGVIQKALRELRASGYEGAVVTDVCLCEYTAHGHCGLVREDGSILVEETLERLAETAVSHARAGADMVAPSAMMDGQVAALRGALDGAGFTGLPIMSYSAKYASAFYGPFRDAADGAPAFGDRKSHQMDPHNGREALVEHRADLDEGADILMVKPGLAYLDVLARSRDAFGERPIAVYNVSGEYSMVKAAAHNGWIDEKAVVLETLTAFRRAGADIVITYHALEAAAWLAESGGAN